MKVEKVKKYNNKVQVIQMKQVNRYLQIQIIEKKQIN